MAKQPISSDALNMGVRDPNVPAGFDEPGYAVRSANTILDAADRGLIDPDSSIAVLARQYLRLRGLNRRLL